MEFEELLATLLQQMDTEFELVQTDVRCGTVQNDPWDTCAPSRGSHQGESGRHAAASRHSTRQVVEANANFGVSADLHDLFRLVQRALAIQHLPEM